MPKSHADKPQQKQDQMAHRLRPHSAIQWEQQKGGVKEFGYQYALQLKNKMRTKKNRRLDKHAICTKKYMKIEFAKS